MAQIRETRFARAGDVDIADQVLGDRPIDLVWIPGWVPHCDLAWGRIRPGVRNEDGVPSFDPAFAEAMAASGIGFEPVGTHVLEGVPGEWPLHRVLD